MIRLIWCQGGNRTSAALAVASGWHYGFRSDDNHHAHVLGPVALLDCKWINADWQRHLQVAFCVRPWLAVVPDTFSPDDLDRTVGQAEQIAPFCENILIVPKCEGLIAHLPRTIGGKPVILGYSVPTGYGGTDLGVWSFRDWPVHLLGGSARKQLDLTGYLNVISVDGNVAWRLARRGIVVTEQGIAGRTIRQLDGQRWHGEGAHLEALRRSLANLRVFWSRFARVEFR